MFTLISFAYCSILIEMMQARLFKLVSTIDLSCCEFPNFGFY